MSQSTALPGRAVVSMYTEQTRHPRFQRTHYRRAPPRTHRIHVVVIVGAPLWNPPAAGGVAPHVFVRRAMDVEPSTKKITVTEIGSSLLSRARKRPVHISST